jgi:hypothetical protein
VTPFKYLFMPINMIHLKDSWCGMLGNGDVSISFGAFNQLNFHIYHFSSTLHWALRLVLLASWHYFNGVPKTPQFLTIIICFLLCDHKITINLLSKSSKATKIFV